MSEGRLSALRMRRSVGKLDDKRLLMAWQLDLPTLQRSFLRAGGRAIGNVEGMDAAGKGGAVRRLVERLDPRGALPSAPWSRRWPSAPGAADTPSRR